MEEWKTIEGFENCYEISNLGRVKSLQRKAKKRNGQEIIIWEKILKPHKDTKGYLQVELKKEFKRKICVIHRLVAKAFIPNPKNKPQVNHINGIKTDNRVENLEWCSGSENVKHAIKNNLTHFNCGEDHPNSKLTNEEALFIKTHYKAHDKKYGMRALMKMFNISSTPIYNIINEKGWKHIKCK